MTGVRALAGLLLLAATPGVGLAAPREAPTVARVLSMTWMGEGEPLRAAIPDVAARAGFDSWEADVARLRARQDARYAQALARQRAGQRRY